MKALILAAGYGTRLRPLTYDLPKPLVEVAGKPLIVHQILNLCRAGITDIIINLSYMADKIKQRIGDGSEYGVNIQYSYEGEKPLGTAGAVCEVLQDFSDEDFIVTSADIFTDFDYATLSLQQQLGHLVLVPNPTFHLHGDFALAKDDYVSLGGEKLTYANIGIFSCQLFAGLSRGYRELLRVLTPAINNHQVTGECFNGRWYNIGTVKELQQLNQLLI